MPLVSKTFSQIITFTRASSATYFDAAGVLQTATTDVPRFDYNPSTLAAQGLLIEESRTNSIRNNTGVGAVNGVIGSGGALPTNWAAQINTTTGLTREVVGTGTENGIAYVDFRLSGTATGAGSFDMFFEQATTVAALTGQTWAGSVFTKLVGGTTNGLSLPRFYLFEYTSAAVFIVAQTLSPGFSLPTAAALNTQRYTGAATLSGGATTAFIRPLINYTIANGAAIDITLRIGLPQLEQGAFATSVIPTTTTAVTRAADVASVNTLSPWFNAVAGTLYAEYMVAGYPPASAFPASAVLSDGTVNNRMLIASTNTGANLYGFGEAVTGGVAQAGFYGATGSAFSTGVTRKSALAYAANDFAFTTQGLAVQTDTSGTVPAVNRLNLGAGAIGNSQFQNGWLRRITYYPRRLSNAELQSITT